MIEIGKSPSSRCFLLIKSVFFSGMHGVCVCVCVNGSYLGEGVLSDELKSLPSVGVSPRVPDVIYSGHQRSLVGVLVQPKLVARVGVESGDTDVNAVRANVETVGELLDKVLDLVKVALLHAARGVQQELDVGRQRSTACRIKLWLGANCKPRFSAFFLLNKDAENRGLECGLWLHVIVCVFCFVF